jgi:hypothetical protein
MRVAGADAPAWSSERVDGSPASVSAPVSKAGRPVLAADTRLPPASAAVVAAQWFPRRVRLERLFQKVTGLMHTSRAGA